MGNIQFVFAAVYQAMNETTACKKMYHYNTIKYMLNIPYNNIIYCIWSMLV